jgi:hypothetical protein
MTGLRRGHKRARIFEGKNLVWRRGTSAEPGEALTLTEYARGDHHIWARAFSDPASWRWLFAQRRVPLAPATH